MKPIKLYTRHFQIAALAHAMGNTEYAIRYLQGMLRSAASTRGENAIKLELAKYL